MGIQQIPLASGGLTTSDLYTRTKWDLITSETTSGTFAYKSITSIPQNYRYLKLIGDGLYLTLNWYLHLRLNSDSTNSYAARRLQHRNNTTGSLGFYNRESVINSGGNGAGANTGLGFELILNNYSDTSNASKFYTFETTFIDTTNNWYFLDNGRYQQTTASGISSIQIFNSQSATFNWSSDAPCGLWLYGGN